MSTLTLRAVDSESSGIREPVAAMCPSPRVTRRPLAPGPPGLDFGAA
jgi:hypothetical protein